MDITLDELDTTIRQKVTSAMFNYVTARNNGSSRISLDTFTEYCNEGLYTEVKALVKQYYDACDLDMQLNDTIDEMYALHVLQNT